MNIRLRVLVFATFFGSCISISLLLGALTTTSWVRAYPRRHNSTESSWGEVNLGLFYGNKDLNPGVGLRSHPVDVYTFITTEPDAMSFWLWLITALGTGFALLSSAIAAVAAVLKAASVQKRHGTMILLFTANISSAAAQVIAFLCWLCQFYQYLTHNVLARTDHELKWYSTGLAHLGYSFYLVIVSTLVVLLNITILIYVKRHDRGHRRQLEEPNEKKYQSAIMLY